MWSFGALPKAISRVISPVISSYAHEESSLSLFSAPLWVAAQELTLSYQKSEILLLVYIPVRLT